MTYILIIDDEPEVGNFLSYLLSKKGYQVSVGYSGEDFQKLLHEKQYDLAMIDVKLPDANGLDILKQLKQTIPMCKAIIMTGYSTVKTAVDAIKFGANDYIEKPFDSIDELEALLEHLLEHNQTPYYNDIHQLAHQLDFIVGKNAEMNHLLTLAYKIAKKNINVLIEGETGSGKEVLAHFIHNASLRSSHPFIGLNCGALSESLLESELFGHEKGAFTGAVKERKGVFEIANKGTLFLDEIAEASSSTQVKLLRTLETGEYMRIGDEFIRRTNTRIISASHVNLTDAVIAKTFREDLLYRLDVIKLTVPPLRDRKQDIPLFLDYFLKKYQSKLTFSNETVEIMKQYDWPGNVRELANVIKRAFTLAEDETTIVTPHYLPAKLQKKPHTTIPSHYNNLENITLESYLEKWTKKMIHSWKVENDVSLTDILQQVKELEVEIGKAFVTKMMKETIGNRKEAADRLNISTRQLRYLLNEKI